MFVLACIALQISGALALYSGQENDDWLFGLALIIGGIAGGYVGYLAA